MIQYIYFVKCPNCEDEPFDFFDEAKDHAMSCLSSKPVITQVEVDRNDFGECTSSSDLGTVWSWEDMMKDMPEDAAELTTFCKSETFDGGDDYFNCEFDDCLDEVPDNFCKPIAEGVPDSTRALRDSDFVIVAKHTDPNSKHGSSKYYSFLGTNLRMTKQLDKAMPYSTQAEAEHDISYAEDQLASDRYINHDQVFVASVPEARNLLNDLNWRKGTQLSFDDMTIEQLVEKMEENEDTVECKSCNELFSKESCTKDPKHGWLCEGCSAAIKSSSETPAFSDEDITEELTQLDEAFKYLADDPDAKSKILDELRADSLLKPCVTEDDALSVNNCITSKWSASGYQMDGRITDFNIDETGEIYVTVSRSADKVIVYTLDDLKSRSSRSFLSYKLLKRIKEIASDLDKAMRPTKAERAAARTAERDANVLDALIKDPEVAKELKANVVRIEYRIPLNDFGYSVDDTDIEDIAISEKSADKLNKIHDNFMNLPFADAAISAGIVEDRPPNTDYDRNISGSWGAIGNITFRVPIDVLSKNAQSLIQFAKYASKAKGEEDATEETKKKKSPRTICCYRLANALIQYFGNDVFFYKELAMAESASDANISSLPNEILEESDEEFYSRLTICPECGAEQSFDHKAGACIHCKFSLNEEY